MFAYRCHEETASLNHQPRTRVNAIGLDSTFGDFATLYNANTDFTGTFFDPVAAGWNLIPEPSTAFLLSFGLAATAMSRRRLRL